MKAIWGGKKISRDSTLNTDYRNESKMLIQQNGENKWVAIFIKHIKILVKFKIDSRSVSAVLCVLAGTITSSPFVIHFYYSNPHLLVRHSLALFGSVPSWKVISFYFNCLFYAYAKNAIPPVKVISHRGERNIPWKMLTDIGKYEQLKPDAKNFVIKSLEKSRHLKGY